MVGYMCYPLARYVFLPNIMILSRKHYGVGRTQTHAYMHLHTNVEPVLVGVTRARRF